VDVFEVYCGEEGDVITREQLVRAFWAALDTAAFDTAAGMMSPDAVVTWPCTGEIFRGRNNFIAVQRHYPGRWRIAVEKILIADECVVSVVRITAEAGNGPSFHATSLFECDAAGKITAIIEYWATDEGPPEWRRTGGWAERS
jgi:ketosteroid isomerase-like protein